MWREKAVNIAGKVINTMPQEEIKETFLDEIEQIENDENFQKMKEHWDKLDEKQKLSTYKKWEMISIWWSFRHVNEQLKPIDLLHLKSDAKNKLWTTAAPVVRLWVSFWLLDAPKWLPEKELLKNIKKDARRLRRNLWIFQKVCAVVPQLKAAAPIVKAIRPYAKRYEKNWAPLMQERIKNKNIEKTEEAIAETLSSSESDVLKSEIMEKEAA